MALKKQLIIGEKTTSKGKSVATTWDIIIPLSGLSPITEDTISMPSQGGTGDIHLPSIYEAQLLQVFVDMKDELAKQQVLFDREGEQAKQDREYASREWEEGNT